MKRSLKSLLTFALLFAIVFSAGIRAGAVYDAISLRVPSYKQFDSRWAALKVGRSGKTMKQIGCAVTSLAMTESYRRGAAVTPDVMESRLAFDGGILYWPDNYVIPSAISYRQLYGKLKEGVPVILGARNAKGKTHFAVVKGYAGGETLSASGFLINDPGSSTRTKLSQFLSAYPTLYRRVHYAE